MIELLTFPVGLFQCNCTLLADLDTKEAVVIDPGDEGPRIAQILKEKGLTPRAFLHTHAHLDHFGGTCHLKKDFGGDIFLHSEDNFLYEGGKMQADLIGLPTPEILPVDKKIQDGEGLSVGEMKINFIHTPGHTPGSVCFYMERTGMEPILFSGDTLFARSIGRTDLWGGDFDLIVKSIRERLFQLEDQTEVVPGHGPNTRIHLEKKSNPFVGIGPL